MELKELGKLFKDERIRQGLSLDDVMDRTKISKRVLTGLEEGREEDLPHPVYTKGLIRNYAKLLGLDQDTLARQFAEYHPELREPQEVEQEIDAALPASESSGRNMAGLVIGAVVVALAGAGFWAVITFWEPVASMFSGEGEQPAVSEPVASAPSAMQPGEPANTTGEREQADVRSGSDPIKAQEKVRETAPVESSDGPAKQVDSDTVNESEPVSASPAPKEQPAPVAPAPAVSEPTPSPAPAPEPAAAEVEQEQTLEIRAVADCWIRAEPDGGGKKDLLLKKGSRVSFQFKESIRLRLGNAGGVRFTLNGTPYPYTADSGAVATVTIP